MDMNKYFLEGDHGSSEAQRARVSNIEVENIAMRVLFEFCENYNCKYNRQEIHLLSLTKAVSQRYGKAVSGLTRQRLIESLLLYRYL